MHSGPCARARPWACELYDAFPTADGIFYASSLNGGEPAMALIDRAEKRAIFSAHPLLHRALADDVLDDTLKDAAYRLGYAFR